MISGASPLDDATVTFIFLRQNETAVFAAQTDGHAAMLIDQGDDFFVDFADQNHFDDIQSFLVGDAHAAHVAAGDAHLVEHRVDLRSATVHHYRIDADVLEQHDVLRKALFELFVFHRMAAVLDDKSLAVEALKIRQRFHQHFCLADKIFHAPGSLDQRI